MTLLRHKHLVLGRETDMNKANSRSLNEAAAEAIEFLRFVLKAGDEDLHSGLKHGVKWTDTLQVRVSAAQSIIEAAVMSPDDDEDEDEDDEDWKTDMD